VQVLVLSLTEAASKENSQAITSISYGQQTWL